MAHYFTCTLSFVSNSYFSGFLTGVLQNHARKVGISVDSLVFNFKVMTSKTDTEDSLGDLTQKLSIRDVAFTVSCPKIIN